MKSSKIEAYIVKYEISNASKIKLLKPLIFSNLYGSGQTFVPAYYSPDALKLIY